MKRNIQANKSSRLSGGAMVFGALASVLGGGCTDDPRYITPAESIEIGIPGTDIRQASTQILLPIRLEREDELTVRGEREAELGYMVPFVLRENLDISLEYTIRNLDPDNAANVRIHVNGANEYFAYVPTAFVVDPDEEEEPPPLAGNIPIKVEPGQTLSGVFREDDLNEAAIDLELITRGALNPFAAMLQIHEEIAFLDEAVAPPIAVEHTAQLIRLDVTFVGDTHLVLEYAVRVRDHRDPNLVPDRGLATDPAELTAFAPTDFTPPPPDDA